MSVIATENARFSNVVKAELWPEYAYCRDVIVVNDTAQTLKVGTVLGKVTATGKYKVAKETAGDGSKAGAAIVIQEVTIAGSTDTKVLALVSGNAIVSKGGLILDATYDNDTKKGVLYADLAALRIKAIDAI